MDDKEISQLRALMSFQHTFTVCCFTTADPQLTSRLVSVRFLIVHIGIFRQCWRIGLFFLTE